MKKKKTRKPEVTKEVTKEPIKYVKASKLPKGWTLAKLKDIDPRSLSTATLKAVVQRMTEEANRRIRRIEKSGLWKKTPALKYLRGGKKHMGKLHYFSSKVKIMTDEDVDKGLNFYKWQYMDKMQELKTFLFEVRTSSLTGAKAFQKTIEERFPGYSKLSRKKKNEFWDAYHRLLESAEGQSIRKKSEQGGVMTSDDAQKLIYSEMKSGSFKNGEEIVDDMQALLDQEYERITEEAENAEQENPLNIQVGGNDEDDTPW